MPSYWFSLKKLFLLVGLLLEVAGISQGNSPGPYFSTLTYYDAVRGDFKQFQDCSAEKLWLFSRHGTRYPHRKEVKTYKHLTKLRDLILENHVKYQRGNLSETDLNLFREWSFEGKKENAGLLTTSGVKELKELGERMLARFPQLLTEYSPSIIKVNVTSKERTQESARAFSSGLYEKPLEIFDFMIDDHLLQIGKKCPAWKESKHKPNARRELEAFRNASIMKESLTDISAALGFPQNLDVETVTSMYEVCGYETAWHHEKTSAWCIPFNEHNLKVMEYMKDLKKYYRSGYGNPLTMKLGCELLGDMVTSLTKEERKATLYFSHDDVLRILLVALGIDEDRIPPTATNYPDMGNRKWKTSVLVPFSANIASVLYRCPEGSYGISEEMRLTVFLNEKAVKLARCDNRDMCGQQEFLRAYESILSPENCNRDFCGQTAETA